MAVNAVKVTAPVDFIYESTLYSGVTIVINHKIAKEKQGQDEIAKLQQDWRVPQTVILQKMLSAQS